MKAFLLIALLAFTACGGLDDLVKLVKCIVNSQELRATLPKVVEAVLAKDYLGLLNLLLNEFPKIKAEVKDCYYDPVLSLTCDVIHYPGCIASCRGKVLKYIACQAECFAKYCN